MATSTYVALDKITVSGTSTTSVTFSSISQAYTDLVLVVNGSLYGAANRTSFVIQLGNGSIDTGTNYSSTWIAGNGTTAVTSRYADGSNLLTGHISEAMGTTIVQFMEYKNTSMYKTVLARGNSMGQVGSFDVGEFVSLWRSTSAINTIKIYPNDGSPFNAGSTFSLYGVAAASAYPAAKATGGTVSYSVDGYTYHTFTSTAAFVPSVALTCDYLIVAGGGGGGGNVGGGGGAGGVRAFASQSFAASTSYTATVGGGGTAGGGSSGAPTAGVSSSFNSTSVSGGGYAGNATAGGPAQGGSGGSGGGSTYNLTSGGAGNTGGYSPVEGYAGGYNANFPSSFVGAGGGGASAAGTNAGSSGAGSGGAGTNTYNSIDFSTWLAVTGSGSSGKVAGGGGGGGYTPNVAGTGGAGGGANGGADPNAGGSGVANTGGGGGGGGANYAAGGGGGSGLVIVRYPSV